MIVLAKYVNPSICPCKFRVLADHIPEGTMYTADTDSIEFGVFMCGGCKRFFRVQMIRVEGGLSKTKGFLPLKIFKLAKEAAA